MEIVEIVEIVGSSVDSSLRTTYRSGPLHLVAAVGSTARQLAVGSKRKVQQG